jgi:hypothetical protein
MANIGAYAAKQTLDWQLGGAGAITQPASRLVALSLGTPTSVSAMGEVATNSGYARQTALFGAAASPAGSASNTAAMTFGPFSSSNAIQGLLIYDTISINSGNIWWYGTLLTARTVLPGDTLVVAAGALIATLS